MGKKQDSIFSRAVGYMRFRYLHSFFGRRMPDEEYIKKMFRYQMNYDLDLEHPRTLNEKLNWLKLYDRNPIYTQMVDKYLAKEYIAGKVGSEYTIPTYGVYDHFDEIDFDDLPEQFVLKTTHDCGGVVICRDKGTFDKKQAGEFLERHLKRKYFYHAREWPYKDVEKKIIAEIYDPSKMKAERSRG